MPSVLALEEMLTVTQAPLECTDLSRIEEGKAVWELSPSLRLDSWKTSCPSDDDNYRDAARRQYPVCPSAQ